jgi:dTMP kinase
MTLPSAYRATEQDKRGVFVAVEGVSGCGKSTLVRRLGADLPAATLHTLADPFTRMTNFINRHTLPLVQISFYLAGALHTSDAVRSQLAHRSVVADRYITSVLVNHASVNGIDVRRVQEVLHPYLPYLAVPDITLYLHTSDGELRRRMAGKPDLSPSDRHLLDHPQILARLIGLYEQFAKDDPHAVTITTDGLNIAEVVTAAKAALKEHAC